MIGAIAGDIIGSVYEWHSYKRTDFPLFDPHSTFPGSKATITREESWFPW
jgi:hypothetical protein